MTGVSRTYDLESQTVFVCKILGTLFSVRHDLPLTAVARVFCLCFRDAAVAVAVYLSERHWRGGAKSPKPNATAERGPCQRNASDDQRDRHDSLARSHLTRMEWTAKPRHRLKARRVDEAARVYQRPRHLKDNRVLSHSGLTSIASLQSRTVKPPARPLSSRSYNPVCLWLFHQSRCVVSRGPLRRG